MVLLQKLARLVKIEFSVPDTTHLTIAFLIGYVSENCLHATGVVVTGRCKDPVVVRNNKIAQSDVRCVHHSGGWI